MEHRDDPWPARFRVLAIALTPTIVMVGAIPLAVRLHVPIPNPQLFLAVTVAFAGFRAGYGAGLTAALLSLAHAASFFSTSLLPLVFTDTNLAKMMVNVLTLPAIGWMTAHLRHSLNRLSRRAAQQFIDDIDLPIATVDVRGRIRRLSPALARLGRHSLGHPEDGMLASFMVPEDRGLAREAIALACQGTPVNGVDLRVLPPPRRLTHDDDSDMSAIAGATATAAAVGEERPVLRLVCSFLPDRDSSGRVLGAVMIAQDSTALHRAHAERQVLLEALERTPIGILITDPSGIIQFANAQIAKDAGFRPEELRGRHVRELAFDTTTENHQRASADLWRTIDSGAVWTGEFLNRRADGTPYWTRNHVVPVHGDDDRVLCHVAFEENITQAKDDEMRLRETADALAASNAELERYAFAAAHDLREPLRNIVGFSQLLERREGLADDPEAREYLSFVIANGKQLNELVNALLEQARHSAASGEAEPCDLNEMLAEIREAMPPSLSSNARIQIAPLPTIRGDSSLLTSLFRNLLHNALKFRAPDRPPVIRIAADIDAAGLSITVTDNGIGIPDDSLEKVFLPFLRLNSRQTYPGSGIGLTLCRRVAALHGGQLTAEPACPPPGTCFRLVLPADILVPAEPAANASAIGGRRDGGDLHSPSARVVPFRSGG